MEFETKESFRQKAEAALGLNMPNPEDVIHRKDFASDAEYAVALAQMTQTMSTPEYRAAARKAGVAIHRENEKEIRQQQRKEYEEIRKGITLTELEVSNIDREAEQIARYNLGSGKIPASQLGAEIAKIANELTKKKKDEKAGDQLFNKMVRRERE